MADENNEYLCLYENTEYLINELSISDDFQNFIEKFPISDLKEFVKKAGLLYVFVEYLYDILDKLKKLYDDKKITRESYCNIFNYFYHNGFLNIADFDRFKSEEGIICFSYYGKRYDEDEKFKRNLPIISPYIFPNFQEYPNKNVIKFDKYIKPHTKEKVLETIKLVLNKNFPDEKESLEKIPIIIGKGENAQYHIEDFGQWIKSSDKGEVGKIVLKNELTHGDEIDVHLKFATTLIHEYSHVMSSIYRDSLYFFQDIEPSKWRNVEETIADLSTLLRGGVEYYLRKPKDEFLPSYENVSKDTLFQKGKLLLSEEKTISLSKKLVSAMNQTTNKFNLIHWLECDWHILVGNHDFKPYDPITNQDKIWELLKSNIKDTIMWKISVEMYEEDLRELDEEAEKLFTEENNSQWKNHLNKIDKTPIIRSKKN